MNAEDGYSLEELFGDACPQIPQALPQVITPEPQDTAAKLARNVHLALDRQREILSQTITEDMDVRRQRLIGENAHHSIKTAVQLDAARMRVQQPDRLVEILARLEEEEEIMRLEQQRRLPD